MNDLRPEWQHRYRCPIGCFTVLLASFVALGHIYCRYNFPYGYSRSCDSLLWMELLSYADQHDGWFPKGESSPEASLSLLGRNQPHWAETLRGKIVPREKVEQILQEGTLLEPKSCGWHYVEGLRRDDPLEIVLFWDKAGLGHNGQRMNNGRNVTLIGGRELIPTADWDTFLEKQRQLLAQLPKREPQPRLPIDP